MPPRGRKRRYRIEVRTVFNVKTKTTFFLNAIPRIAGVIALIFPLFRCRVCSPKDITGSRGFHMDQKEIAVFLYTGVLQEPARRNVGGQCTEEAHGRRISSTITIREPASYLLTIGKLQAVVWVTVEKTLGLHQRGRRKTKESERDHQQTLALGGRRVRSR